MKEEATTNLTMLCDFYELTMGNGYFINGMADTITYFDVFFRRCPDEGGFAIAAGLEQVIDYINNLHFTEADLAYLRSRGMFDEAFLDYLRTFRFTGDIYAVPEGTPEGLVSKVLADFRAHYVHNMENRTNRLRTTCGIPSLIIIFMTSPSSLK